MHALRLLSLGFVVALLGCPSSETTCTDTQTDPANCGSCGHSCLGGTCSSGVCQPFAIATVNGAPNRLEVTATHVYFVERDSTGASVLKRVPIAGGTAEPLATLGTNANEIALQGTDVYVSVIGANQIVRVPQTGGTPVNLVTGGTLSQPTSFVIDGTRLLVSNNNRAAVSTLALAGGSAIDFATVPTGSAGFSISGANLYIAHFQTTTGKVAAVSLAGMTSGQVTDLATNQDRPYATTVNATHVFFTNYGSGEVRRVPVGGGPSEPLATGLDLPTGLALDSQYVYWTNYAEASDGNPPNGSVQRVALAGGTPETLASSQDGPFDIALDANSIYWSNRWGNAVMRLAKP